MSENQNNPHSSASLHTSSSSEGNDENFRVLVYVCFLFYIADRDYLSDSPTHGQANITPEMPLPRQPSVSGASPETPHDLPQNEWEDGSSDNVSPSDSDAWFLGESPVGFPAGTGAAPQSQPGNVTSANAFPSENHPQFPDENLARFHPGTGAMPQSQWDSATSTNAFFNGNHAGFPPGDAVGSQPMTRAIYQSSSVTTSSANPHVNGSHSQFSAGMGLPFRNSSMAQSQWDQVASAAPSLNGNHSRLPAAVSRPRGTGGMPQSQPGHVASGSTPFNGSYAGYQPESPMTYSPMSDRSATRDPRRSGWGNRTSASASHYGDRTGYQPESQMSYSGTHHMAQTPSGHTVLASIAHNGNGAGYHPETHANHGLNTHQLAQTPSRNIASGSSSRDDSEMDIDPVTHNPFEVRQNPATVHDELFRFVLPEPLPARAPEEAQHQQESHTPPEDPPDDLYYHDGGRSEAVLQPRNFPDRDELIRHAMETGAPVDSALLLTDWHNRVVSGTTAYNGSGSSTYGTEATHTALTNNGSGSSARGTEATSTALSNNGSALQSQSQPEATLHVNTVFLPNHTPDLGFLESSVPDSRQGKGLWLPQSPQNAAPAIPNIQWPHVPPNTRISLVPFCDTSIHVCKDIHGEMNEGVFRLPWIFSGALALTEFWARTNSGLETEDFGLEFLPRAGTDEVVLINKGWFLIYVAQILDTNQTGPTRELVVEGKIHLEVGFWHIWTDKSPRHLVIQIHQRSFEVFHISGAGAGSMWRRYGGGDGSAGGAGTDWGQGVPQSEVDDALVTIRPGEMLHVSAPSMCGRGQESYNLTCTQRVCTQVIVGWQSVYKAYVAAKVVRDPHKARVRTLSQEWEAEVTALTSLSHRSIVEIVGADARLMAIYLRPYECENLAQLRDDTDMFVGTRSDAGYVLADMGSALEYIHSQGFTHFDVKPANILYDKKECKAILIDFGLASKRMRPELRGAGTPWYAPPEYVDDDWRGPASDMYALGVVMLYLLGRMPLPDVTEDWWSLSRVYDRSSPESYEMSYWIATVQSIAEEGRGGRELDELTLGLLHQDPAQRFTGSRIGEDTGTEVELD